jgi:AcrR family transcriptional regulator
MARTLNPAAHAVRRDAFIDVAERLIQLKGYEQLSIGELLDELDASKGAFYHYFDSKAALLEAVIGRMVDAGIAAVTPVLTDRELSAIERLNGLFAGIATFKGERTELVRAVIEVWLADENAVVREKFRKGIMPRLRPLLARIIEQGQAEGTVVAGSPIDIARVLVSFIQANQDVATELYAARQFGLIRFDEVERAFEAYREALERILGVPPGSVRVVDRQVLHYWYG